MFMNNNHVLDGLRLGTCFIYFLFFYLMYVCSERVVETISADHTLRIFPPVLIRKFLVYTSSLI